MLHNQIFSRLKKLEFQKKTYIDALESKFWFQFCLERIKNLHSLETFSIFTSMTIHLDVKGKQPTKTQNIDVKVKSSWVIRGF